MWEMSPGKISVNESSNFITSRIPCLLCFSFLSFGFSQNHCQCLEKLSCSKRTHLPGLSGLPSKAADATCGFRVFLFLQVGNGLGLLTVTQLWKSNRWKILLKQTSKQRRKNNNLHGWIKPGKAFFCEQARFQLGCYKGPFSLNCQSNGSNNPARRKKGNSRTHGRADLGRNRIVKMHQWNVVT